MSKHQSGLLRNRQTAILKQQYRVDMYAAGEEKDRLSSNLSLACLDKKPVSEIMELIKNGADVNQPNFSGYTPLMSACMGDTSKNAVDIAQLLVECGADVNAVHKTTRRTPLHFSALLDDKLCCFLLNQPVDINAVCEKGMTPLMFMARNGFVYAIEEMIKKNVNIHALNDNNENALLMACSYIRKNTHNTSTTITLLVEAGADINQICKNHTTVVTRCILYKINSVDYLLSKNPNLNHSDPEGIHVITKGIVHAPEYIQTLLEHGAKMDTQYLEKIAKFSNKNYYIEMIDAFYEKQNFEGISSLSKKVKTL